MDSAKLDILKKIGNEWKHGEHHRIYINNLSEIYGLELNYYNTGNISSATLDNEKISNGAASKLSSALDSGKLWFALTTDEWKAQGLDIELATHLVRKIEAMMVEVEVVAEIIGNDGDHYTPAFSTIDDAHTYYINSGFSDWEWFERFVDNELVEYLYRRSDSVATMNELVAAFISQNDETPVDYGL